MDQTTTEELTYLKAQYYGKTTMVDKWFGKFMEKVDALGLADDTMVIFTTDHGHDLGGRGIFGNQYPYYDSHANIPMTIRYPKEPGKGKRVSDFTQTVYVFSTAIDAASGVPPATTRHSKSVMQIVRGSTGERGEVLYGTFGQGVCLTDGEWTLFKSPNEGKPPYSYSTMISRPLLVDNPIDGRVGALPAEPVGHENYDPTVPYPMWKLPIQIDPHTRTDFLFNRTNDPGQTNNLWDVEPEQRQRMLALLVLKLEEEGCPLEQFHRLGLDRPTSIAAE